MNSIIQASDGDFVLSGYTDLFGKEMHEIWLMRINNEMINSLSAIHCKTLIYGLFSLFPACTLSAFSIDSLKRKTTTKLGKTSNNDLEVLLFFLKRTNSNRFLPEIWGSFLDLRFFC